MSPQEIQSLLSPIVEGDDLTLQINYSGSQLVVVMNRALGATEPDYSALADLLIDTLRDSNLQSVKTIRLYAREKGAKQLDWQDQRALTEDATASQIIKPMNSVKVTQPKSESRFVKAFERFRLIQETVSAIALLGILGVLLTNSLAGQKVQRVTWEYQVDSIPDLEFEEKMDELGAEGWELAFARRARNSLTDEFSYEVIFKRKQN